MGRCIVGGACSDAEAVLGVIGGLIGGAGAGIGHFGTVGRIGVRLCSVSQFIKKERHGGLEKRM